MNILYEMFPEFNFNDANHDKGGPPVLEELKIWAHVFSCTSIQVCMHAVHTASFMHMSYLCMHPCMQIVHATVYMIMHFK